MARSTRSQSRARSDLFAALDTACRIYAPARDMCRFTSESFDESPYQPNVAAKVVGLAFLSACAAWDDFVEEVYFGYLSGYPSPSGYLPKLLSGPARNKGHALLLAAGDSNPRDAERKLRWSSFKWVRSLSGVHFHKDNVFMRVAEADLAWLELAQIVRNRVAHNSEKAKHQYKVALNKLMGQPDDLALPKGFAPGKFLIYTTANDPVLAPLRLDEYHWGDVFERYVSLWRRLAAQLSPGDA